MHKKNIIQTEHLIIREFQHSDLQALAPILAKPEVMQFSTTGVLSTKTTAAKIQSFIDSYSEHGYGKWAVIHCQSGNFKKCAEKLIGYCGIAVEEIEGGASHFFECHCERSKAIAKFITNIIPPAFGKTSSTQ